MNSFAQSQAHVKEYIRKAAKGECPEVNHVAELVAEEMIEEEVRMENALLALLILKQYQIKKRVSRRNSSSGDGEEEEDEEDYEDDDEVTDETPVGPRRDNVLSRKRARSPSREITPCPGPNRESLMMLQARKRVKTEPTSTPSTALTTPASTSPPVAYAAMASTPRASSATLPVQRPLHFGALPAAAAAAALARAQAQMPPRMPPAMPQRPVGATTTTTTSRTINGGRITTTITSAGGITTRMVSAPSAAAATNAANVAAPRPMAVPRGVMATSRPVAGSRPVINARGLGLPNPNPTTTTNALPAAVIANKQGLSTTNTAAPRGLGNATATGTTPGPKPFTITIPPGARRPDATCIRAMRDVKARMTGQATDAHIAAVCRKFLVYPKLPTAYLAVCDEGKQDLFWMFAGDMSTLQLRVLDNCEPASMLYAKGILKRRMGPYVPPWPVRAPAQQQASQPLGYNSVLKTQHMKEIDLRPRPSLRDRVTTWLGNVSGP